MNFVNFEGKIKNTTCPSGPYTWWMWLQYLHSFVAHLDTVNNSAIITIWYSPRCWPHHNKPQINAGAIWTGCTRDVKGIHYAQILGTILGTEWKDWGKPWRTCQAKWPPREISKCNLQKTQLHHNFWRLQRAPTSAISIIQE